MGRDDPCNCRSPTSWREFFRETRRRDFRPRALSGPERPSCKNPYLAMGKKRTASESRHGAEKPFQKHEKGQNQSKDNHHGGRGSKSAPSGQKSSLVSTSTFLGTCPC